MPDEPEKPQSETQAQPADGDAAKPSKAPADLDDVVAGLKTEQEPAAGSKKESQRRAKPTSLDELDKDTQDLVEREIARRITLAKEKWTEREERLATESEANRQGHAHSQSAEDHPLTLRQVQDMMARQRSRDVQDAQRKANVRELTLQAQLTTEQQREFAAFITECARNPEKHGFDPALALLQPASTLAMARASGILSPKSEGPGGPGETGSVFAEPIQRAKARENAVDAFNHNLYGDLKASRAMTELAIKSAARKAVADQIGEGPVSI